MMNGFSRFRSLAAAVVALGLLGGEARAGFLADVAATLNTPSTGADTVGGSSLTLTAQYMTGSSGGLLSGPVTVDPASPSTQYSWTLTFPAAGTPGFAMTSTINGVAGSTTDLITPTSPITGFYVSGSEIYFQFAGYAGGAAPAGSASYSTYVEINTFKNSINVGLIPPNALGQPNPAGGLTPTPVPEPSTIALLGIGGLTLIGPRRLRRLCRRPDA